jgi:MFS transporter, DHA3 family, tetracycline resistance protein
LTIDISRPLSRDERRHLGRDVATIFLRWTFVRAIFHRGYVLVALLYFVLDAHLSASQLAFLGTAMSLTLALSDVPTGVWADAIGRKRPLVIGHMFLAAGMVMTGVVTSFALLLTTQVLWALGWAFSGGADVAWLTDELDRPERIDRMLAARARWDLMGGATGMVAFGLLGWVFGLTPAIAVSGIAMALLGLFVAVRFNEHNFTPAPERRWSASLSIFKRGLALAAGDYEILLVFAATTIINGAAMVGWLFPKQLVNLGFPNDPVLWWTSIEILSFAVGVVSLHFVEPRIDGAGVARRTYALACFFGVLGMIVLAYAPDFLIGGGGILLATGIAFNVTRPVSVIWVNRRATSDVRTTVHSSLSQAESIGEIFGGFALAFVAKAGDIQTALIVSGVLLAVAGTMVALSGADRASGDRPISDDRS